VDPSPNYGLWGLTWSPDGSQLAFARGQVFVLDTLGTAQRLSSSITMVRSAWPEFSRDGAWVYFSGDDAVDGPTSRVWRMAADGSTLEEITAWQPWSDGDYVVPTVSPDGTRLAITEAPAHRVSFVDLTTGGVDDDTLIAFTPRWSPTDDVIAFASDSGLYTIGADSRELTQLLPWRPCVWCGLSWSPDGEWLIYRAATITLVNATTGLELPLAFARYLIDPVWRP
jgi:Tol biopolymer transport system component